MDYCGCLQLFSKCCIPFEKQKVDDDFSRLWNTQVMQVETTDFLVDLANLNRTKTNLSRRQTAEGDVLVRVEQFAFTANNMTYALIGASTGWYWDFFLAPRGWGRATARVS